MFPEGIKAMGEAVAMVASGKYPKVPQTEEGATYDPIWKNKEKVAKIKWAEMTSAEKLHNFIRGNDRVPGAWATVGDEQVTFYNSTILGPTAAADAVLGEAQFDECPLPVSVTAAGIAFTFPGNARVCVGKFQVGRRIMNGADFLSRNDVTEERPLLDLTPEETTFKSALRETWAGILSLTPASIEGDTDFFDSGAGSMDVVRLIEETKQKAKRAKFSNPITVTADGVAAATTFDRYVDLVVRDLRGMVEEEIQVDTVNFEASNGIDVSMPHQCFINGNFVDAVSGKTYQVLDTTTLFHQSFYAHLYLNLCSPDYQSKH